MDSRWWAFRAGAFLPEEIFPETEVSESDRIVLSQLGEANLVIREDGVTWDSQLYVSDLFLGREMQELLIARFHKILDDHSDLLRSPHASVELMRQLIMAIAKPVNRRDQDAES